MKKITFTFIFSTLVLISFAQNDSTYYNSNNEEDLDLLMDDEPSSLELLPPKMMYTQRLVWGEKGLLRKTNILPLTNEGRQLEMKLRRTFLVTHQLVGFATFASILGTATTGFLLYNGNRNVKDLHEGFAGFTNGGYIAGAVLGMFSPPPLISRSGKKWDSIDWHKFFAYGHILGMITTNILSEKASEGGDWKNAHRISGTATGIFFTCAIVSIKF